MKKELVLKVCPICGSQPKLSVIQDIMPGTKEVITRGYMYDCANSPYHVHGLERHSTQDQAVRDWNEHVTGDREKNELELKAYLLECIIRNALDSSKYTDAMRSRILAGINTVLSTHFDISDASEIFDTLGMGRDPALTREFINSGYDMKILNK